MTQITIDDLIVLGRAAPDELKDGRQTVCVGGWSQKLGFTRIYPTTIESQLQRWNKVSLPAERNSQDPRAESWKIQGSKTDWDNLHKKISVTSALNRQQQINLVNQIPQIDCTETLNEYKLSLGIIKPKHIRKTYFEKRENIKDTSQSNLAGWFLDKHFKDKRVKTKGKFPIIPKIDWECPGPCKLQKKFHTSQVLEWGVYKWFENSPESEWVKVWENLRLQDNEYEKFFFVGNSLRHLRSFMVISILRFKKNAEYERIVANSSLDNYF